MFFVVSLRKSARLSTEGEKPLEPAKALWYTLQHLRPYPLSRSEEVKAQHARQAIYRFQMDSSTSFCLVPDGLPELGRLHCKCLLWRQ